MVAMATLNRIWWYNTISFTSKFKLYQSLVTSILLCGVKHGPRLLILKEWSKESKPGALGNFFASPTWSTRPTTGCEARSASLWFHRNLFWQLSRNGNLLGSGMSHATTASPKPFFRAPCMVGDAMVGRVNAGQTILKSGHPCPCQNSSQGPLAKKT